MYIYLYEKIEELKKAKSEEEIVNILKKYDGSVLRAYFYFNYSPKVVSVYQKWDMPEYREQDLSEGLHATNLDKEIRRLKYFAYTKPSYSDREKHKIDLMCIEICEGLPNKEAEIFRTILKKELYIPNMTYEEINEAFGEDFLEKPEVQGE